MVAVPVYGMDGRASDDEGLMSLAKVAWLAPSSERASNPWASLIDLAPQAISDRRQPVGVGQKVASARVSMARLDAIVHEDVAFVKVDVEGHELNVLNGAVELLENSQPVFLVEAEDRHRAQATRLLFDFFDACCYRGYFFFFPPHLDCEAILNS